MTANLPCVNIKSIRVTSPHTITCDGPHLWRAPRPTLLFQLDICNYKGVSDREHLAQAVQTRIATLPTSQSRIDAVPIFGTLLTSGMNRMLSFLKMYSWFFRPETLENYAVSRLRRVGPGRALSSHHRAVHLEGMFAGLIYLLQDGHGLAKDTNRPGRYVLVGRRRIVIGRSLSCEEPEAGGTVGDDSEGASS